MSDQNKIKQKHVDFIICNYNLKTLIAIELNDASHMRYDRMKRDDEVTYIFKTAKMPLLWIESWQQNNIEQIENLIKEKM